MSDGTRLSIRAQLHESLEALAALRAVAQLAGLAAAALPSTSIAGDYQLVRTQLESEALEAIRAAAAELRKPTVGELVDRLWSAGPLTFEQIRAAVRDSGVTAGDVETL